ncbi:hypothetical protein LU293_04790 [Moraxella nasovis]|uniref:hypothetical protein n=1 Tax=Moraxella nasovis TaxID=2904121 RepID=UPI001F60AD98|nr:hypothetical protein [Moraxella nasovis]UNU74214.1 hypothetical protein LU293_04790 [Moraxella nasovis]
MLATYQAKLVNNQIEWLDTPPQSDEELYLAITILPKAKPSKPKRQMPAMLKGCGVQNDDIIDTSEIWQDWEYLK